MLNSDFHRIFRVATNLPVPFDPRHLSRHTAHEMPTSRSADMLSAFHRAAKAGCKRALRCRRSEISGLGKAYRGEIGKLQFVAPGISAIFAAATNFLSSGVNAMRLNTPVLRSIRTWRREVRIVEFHAERHSFRPLKTDGSTNIDNVSSPNHERVKQKPGLKFSDHQKRVCFHSSFS